MHAALAAEGMLIMARLCVEEPGHKNPETAQSRRQMAVLEAIAPSNHSLSG